MTTFFDSRGVRRLSLLCDFIVKVANDDHDDVTDSNDDNTTRWIMFCTQSFVTNMNEFRRMKVQAVGAR